MKGLLGKIGIPVAALALLFGAAWWARKMDFITPEVGYWLWPALVALALIVFAVLAFIRDQRVWVWPFAVGFVVQVLGIFMMMPEPRNPDAGWRALWYTLGAIGLVLLVMGAVWLFNYVRARRLERQVAEGLAEGVEGNQAELGRIRENMLEAMALLRRAGKGRNAIYQLPWVLLMGRPAAGKTVAIKNSGLGLPVKKDWVKGRGGTYTSDWFFTNDLIFVDTPGKWVTEGQDSMARKQWLTLMGLLKKYRGQRPLDGLVVVVPADDLISMEEESLEEQAANIREVVDLIHKELTFRFPIYLLISKSDLCEGFVDFFRGLPAQRRQEILGWSNPKPSGGEVAGAIHKGFTQVRRRLEGYRLEMLGRVRSRTQARKLFFFTEEFKALEQPLTVFADAFFQSSRYEDAPAFRGFFFTSGTQGEGVPLSRALTSLAQTMGVTPSQSAEAEEDEPKRSYFLLDLFRELIVGDEGLVGRTAGHWWRRRRNTMLGAFAPAGLAILILLLSVVSFIWNRSIYRGYASTTPATVEELEEYSVIFPSDEDGNVVLPVLERTGQLQDAFLRVTTFSPFRSLGMRRPKDLGVTTLALFRQEFRDAALEPTLTAAESIAMDSGRDCMDRLDMLHSVVRLRMGELFQGVGDLASLDRVWELRPEEAGDAREAFHEQYYTYKLGLTGQPGDTGLPGFSIRRVTRSIQNDCGEQGSTSVLAKYLKFQDLCREAVTDDQINKCMVRLNEALDAQQADVAKLAAHLDDLWVDLETLRREEDDAEYGLKQLAEMDVFRQRGSRDIADPDESEWAGCLTDFSGNIGPVMRDYVTRGDFLLDCQSEVSQVAKRADKARIVEDHLAKQEESLDEVDTKLKGLVGNYNGACLANRDFGRLELSILTKIVTSGLRIGCLPRRVTNGNGEVVTVVVVPETRWLTASKSVNRGYTKEHWLQRHTGWDDEIQVMQGGRLEGELDATRGRIRGEVSSFAKRYVKHWRDYLDGLSLKAQASSITEWLRELSSTDEYQKLLKLAASAVNLQDTTAEAPFDRMQEQLDGLEDLSDLVNSGLTEYQNLLEDVAEDLENCEAEPQDFLSFQQEVSAEERDNSLVKALDWVDRNGSTVAEGRLSEIFEDPLLQAQRYVLENDSPIRAKWDELRTLYDAEIDGRMPFAIDESSEESVKTEGLKGLFGAKSGAVVKLRNAARGAELSADAEAWLQRAEQWSVLLFDPGTDNLRKLRATLAMESITFEPPETEKRLQVMHVHIALGSEGPFKWEVGKDDEHQTRRLDFFDKAINEFAYVKGILTEKKGALARVFSGNWRELPGTIAKTAAGDTASVESDLAPLRLLKMGISEDDMGRGIGLTYILEGQQKNEKKEPPKAILMIRVSGDVPELFDLMSTGLGAPPKEPIEGG